MKFSALVALVGAPLVAEAARSGSPVERVVILLKDISTKIEADGKAELQMYNKYACWCEKTSLRKAQAIEKGQEDLRALGQEILKFKALVNVRTSEIAQLGKDIKNNKQEQADATQLRSNQNGAFTAETTEKKTAIAAMQKATQVIVEGAGGAAFLQTDAAASSVRAALASLPGTASVSIENLAFLSEFARGRTHLSQPQSATIQGILKDMYETFVTDLESATMTEATQNREYETLMSIKAQELSELESTKATKESEKADAEANLAENTQSYDDTDTQKRADIEFFDATKAACDAKHGDWVTRQDLRAEESAGIAEALKILTSDEARELFAKSIQAGQGSNQAGASFLQVSAEASMTMSMRAYTSLKTQARKVHSLRLARIAAKVRMAGVGHFDGVIKDIDDMIQVLKDEGQADIDKRDQCIEEYKNTDSVMTQKTWDIEKNQAKINKLQGLMDKHTATKEETIQAIADTKVNIQEMKDTRDAEHQAFLQAKADDEGAIALLGSAIEAMSKFYKKNGMDMGPIQASVKAASFVEKKPTFEVSADQAPEADFSAGGSSKGQSKGIISMMTMIKQDLEVEIKNGQEAEASAQLEFEGSLKAAETLLADLIVKKENLETEIARLGDEKTGEHEVKTGNEKDLKDEQDYRKRITPDCDWIIGAFEGRAQKRTAEQNGLVSAKEHLATR
jgi:hypothetical protein